MDSPGDRIKWLLIVIIVSAGLVFVGLEALGGLLMVWYLYVWMMKVNELKDGEVYEEDR